MINNDDRIGENSFLNDVLDDDNIENGNVSSMDESDIIDFEITSPLLLQNVRPLNVKQWQNFQYVLIWEKEKVKQKS